MSLMRFLPKGSKGQACKKHTIKFSYKLTDNELTAFEDIK